MKKVVQRTEFIQQAYTQVKLKQLADKMVKDFNVLPPLMDHKKQKELKKVILQKNLEDEKEGQTGEKDKLNGLKTGPDLVFNKIENKGEENIGNSQNNFAMMLKAVEDQSQPNGLESIALANRKLDLASNAISKSEPAVPNRPPPGEKIIEIDELIDSPEKPKTMEVSPILFQFRSMRSDGSEIVIKNSVTGTDTRSLYKELVT